MQLGNIVYSGIASGLGPGAANNGLSVSGGIVQLGGAAGSATAANLLNNREIPFNGFGLTMSGLGSVANAHLIFKRDANGPVIFDPVYEVLSSASVQTFAFRLNASGSSQFFGTGSGLLSTGGGNTGIGNGVLATITAAGRNICIGNFTMTNCGTTAADNVVIGQDAFDTTGGIVGTANVAIGIHVQAGNNGVGDLNTLVGGGINDVSPGPIGSFNCVFGSTNYLNGVSNTTMIGRFNNLLNPITLNNVCLIGNNTQNIILNADPTTITDNGSRLQVLGSMSLPITVQAGNFTLTAAHYTVIFTAAATATLPTAAAGINRIYVIAAAGAAFNVTTSINYNNLANASVNLVAAGTSIMIQSDGTTWRQIK